MRNNIGHLSSFFDGRHFQRSTFTEKRLRYYAAAPIGLEHYAMMAVVRLSVRPSVCPVSCIAHAVCVGSGGGVLCLIPNQEQKGVAS